MSDSEPELPEASTSTGAKKKASAQKHKARARKRAAASLERQLEGATFEQEVRESLEQAGESDAAAALTPELLAESAKALRMDDYLKGKAGLGGVGTKDMGSHKFWSTQPVPKLGAPQQDAGEGPIEDDRPANKIRQEPYELPKEFEWSTVDVDEPAQLVEVQSLLDDHYVEDHEASFRFAYVAPFIKLCVLPSAVPV